jgi:hypothetical protein
MGGVSKKSAPQFKVEVKELKTFELTRLLFDTTFFVENQVVERLVVERHVVENGRNDILMNDILSKINFVKLILQYWLLPLTM